MAAFVVTALLSYTFLETLQLSQNMRLPVTLSNPSASIPYLKFRLHVRFLSRAPNEGFLGGVAVVDSPAACEDDGELLRLSSVLLIGSTAISSVTTIMHLSAFIS